MSDHPGHKALIDASHIATRACGHISLIHQALARCRQRIDIYFRESWATNKGDKNSDSLKGLLRSWIVPSN
jgi:hypothetical protein